MLDEILFIAAAVANILAVALDIWREWKSRVRSDGKGGNGKGRQ